LLHDIGKLDTSRKLLYKAAQLPQEEYEGIRKHVDKGAQMLEPVAGPLRRIIPIILAHHDRFDGSGYHPVSGNEIPLEARIIAVADVYDSLTSDRPYRKAISPFDVKEAIVRGSGTEFDPRVVKAFLAAFHKGGMEVPEVIL
jgi:HD-GYP domain-containing protein (c-di-GMP phosphodiesterase class II)